MPGPGPHMMYTLGVGTGLMRLSHGRFTSHHCLFYAFNAFLGPDLGSFTEWLTFFFPDGSFARRLGSLAMQLVHHPFYYIFLLGFPLSVFYAWLSRVFLHKGLIDTISGVALSKKQCFCLVVAGSLSHFFLDHLFEENGHSSMYTWILSTGWWEGRAPINPDSVIIIGFLCTCMIIGFAYINSVLPVTLEKPFEFAKCSRNALTGAKHIYPVCLAELVFLTMPTLRMIGKDTNILKKCSSLVISSIKMLNLQTNEAKCGESITEKANKSLRLILATAILYCIWCAIQLYLRNPPQPADGEEADLGVLVFLSVFFFLPHAFCFLSLAHKDYGNEKLPL